MFRGSKYFRYLVGGLLLSSRDAPCTGTPASARRFTLTCIHTSWVNREPHTARIESAEWPRFWHLWGCPTSLCIRILRFSKLRPASMFWSSRWVLQARQTRVSYKSLTPGVLCVSPTVSQEYRPKSPAKNSLKSVWHEFFGRRVSCSVETFTGLVNAKIYMKPL